MKRLIALAALAMLVAGSIGCGNGSLRNMCRWRRPAMGGCDQCQNMTGMPGVYDGMIYEGVVDEGVVEEIPAGKASTRP